MEDAVMKDMLGMHQYTLLNMENKRKLEALRGQISEVEAQTRARQMIHEQEGMEKLIESMGQRGNAILVNEQLEQRWKEREQRMEAVLNALQEETNHRWAISAEHAAEHQDALNHLDHARKVLKRLVNLKANEEGLRELLIDEASNDIRAIFEDNRAIVQKQLMLEEQEGFILSRAHLEDEVMNRQVRDAATLYHQFLNDTQQLKTKAEEKQRLAAVEAEIRRRASQEREARHDAIFEQGVAGGGASAFTPASPSPKRAPTPKRNPSPRRVPVQTNVPPVAPEIPRPLSNAEKIALFRENYRPETFSYKTDIKLMTEEEILLRIELDELNLTLQRGGMGVDDRLTMGDTKKKIEQRLTQLQTIKEQQYDAQQQRAYTPPADLTGASGPYLDYRNAYDILKLPQTATQQEVKKAFQKLAQAYHPDTHPNASTSERESMIRNFKRVGWAYDHLRNLEQRRDYDWRLGQTAPPQRPRPQQQRAGGGAAARPRTPREQQQQQQHRPPPTQGRYSPPPQPASNNRYSRNEDTSFFDTVKSGIRRFTTGTNQNFVPDPNGAYQEGKHFDHPPQFGSPNWMYGRPSQNDNSHLNEDAEAAAQQSHNDWMNSTDMQAYNAEQKRKEAAKKEAQRKEEVRNLRKMKVAFGMRPDPDWSDYNPNDPNNQ